MEMVDFITSSLMMDLKPFGISEKKIFSLTSICGSLNYWFTARRAYITFVCIWKFEKESPLAALPPDVIKVILQKLPNLKENLINLILKETLTV